MLSLHRLILRLLASICVLSTAHAADIVAGNVTTALGLDFFAGTSSTTVTASFSEPGPDSAYATADDGGDLTGFSPDSNVLIENLGGGLYRATAATAPAAVREFFRFKLTDP